MLFRLLFLLFAILASQTTGAQSQFSFIPGAYYNGSLSREYASGFGGVLGLEYMPRPDHFFALEARIRYGIYLFNDGTSWRENNDGSWEPPIRENARLEYSLFSPQIGIVPKLYYHFDEDLSVFLETELTEGLIAGRFKYGGTPYTEKSFTEPIFYYSIVGGFRIKGEEKKDWSVILSAGYSSLNFKKTIEKKQPRGYQGETPNQEAVIMINIIFKIPLNKRF